MNWFREYLTNISIRRLIPSNSDRSSVFVWITITTLAIIFTAYKIVVEWHQTQQISLHVNFYHLLIGFGIYSVSLLLTASCWALIIGFFSGRRVFWNHVRIFCLTNVAQRLPTPIPYIVARTEIYARQNLSRNTVLTAMAVEVTITLCSALIVVLLTIPFMHSFYDSIEVALLSVSIILLSAPLIFIKAITSILGRLSYPLLSIMPDVRYILVWIAIFSFIWVNSGVLHYALISSFFTIPMETLPALICTSAISGIVGWMSQILFFLPTPAIRQLTMIYLLNIYFPMPLAVASTIFIRICIMVFELIWAGIFLTIPSNKEFLHTSGDKQ